jgi:hypothetical protein
MAKKRKAKPTCLGCGHLMGRKDRFCSNCRRRNPNVAARPVMTGKAAAGTVTKAAAAGYAPVASLQAVRQQQAWREINASPNPETRETLFQAYFGGAA